MPFVRLTLITLILSTLPWMPACERSRAEADRHSPTIRISAGILPRLSSELDFLKDMDPERAPATPIPLHPGATRYYRERLLRR